MSRLKSENKELRYQLAENLKNLTEQATGLQKCIAENGTLKKSFVITRQKLESWKPIKLMILENMRSCLRELELGF